MKKHTNIITFYIIIFFVSTLIILGLFFVYKIFFEKVSLPEYESSLDKKFNDVIRLKEEESYKTKEEENVEYAEYSSVPCIINDDVYEHGTIKDFFSRLSVGVYQSCNNFSKVKRCDNGIWLGNSKFQFSSCERTVNCKLNEDTMIENGESRELYSREIVPYGNSCESYKMKRICKETILTGNDSFKYKNCQVSYAWVCKISDGNGGENILGDERSHTFYSQEQVKYDESCSDFSQNRVCSKGVLYGTSDFYSWTCNRQEAKNCNIDGMEIVHGTSRPMYSWRNSAPGKPCFVEIRSCVNGQLDGQDEYSYTSCS